LQTANLDGVKEAVITRARIQLMKVQDILKDVNTFTSQLLVRTGLLVIAKL
jgi:hypothetical protein